MCIKKEINKEELLERFNEFVQTYKIHYLMAGETSELKQNHPLFCLIDTIKLQEDIISCISEKTHSCKMNLCNKKSKVQQ